VPAENEEEFLGEYDAGEQTTISSKKYVVVNARKTVRLDADTMTHETAVNVFRGEIVGG
jgi:hypothetical protein